MSTFDSRAAYDWPNAMPVGKLRDESLSMPKDPWSAVFGDPRYPHNASPYDIHNRTTLTLPDAFVGLRQKLSETIEREVFHDGNWHLRTVMPFDEYPDGMVVTWNEIRFNRHLASPTPELGVVRLVESKRIENSASFVRYGIGYYMQHGFMSTREGLMYHMEHLRQMAQAALETAKFDVVFSLKQHANVHKRWEIENGVFQGMKLEAALANRVWMFAAMQKYKRPLNLIDTRVTETMNKYGGKADTWIIPPQIINYLENVPDEYLSYKEAGPRGPDIVFDRTQHFGILNKNQVFVSRTYHTDAITGREDVLSQRSEIGEYYLMEDRHKDDHTGYRSRWRHIQIYDEDSNRWHEVSLQWALDHSMLFNADNSPRYSNESVMYDHRLSGDAGEVDIWRYYQPDGQGGGEYRNARYFGEIPEDYFTVQDKLEWANTAIAWINRNNSDAAGFTAAWNEKLTQLSARDTAGFIEGEDDIGAGYQQLSAEHKATFGKVANAIRQLTYNPSMETDEEMYLEFMLPHRTAVYRKTDEAGDDDSYERFVAAAIDAVHGQAPVDTRDAQSKLGNSELDSYKKMIIAAIGRLGKAEADDTVYEIAQNLSGRSLQAVQKDAAARITDNIGAFSLKSAKDVETNLSRFTDNFKQLWAQYRNNSTGSQGWEKTDMLASPTWMATLANHLENGGSTNYMPADPDRPDLVMSRERLLRDTLHHRERRVTPDQRRRARASIGTVHPSFHVEISSRNHGSESLRSVCEGHAAQLAYQIASQQTQTFGAEHDSLPLVGAERMQAAIAALGDAVHQPISLDADMDIGAILDDTARKGSVTWNTSKAGIEAEAQNDLQKTLALAFDAQQIDKRAYLRCIKNDLVYPLAHIINRPHMAYNMLMAIKCLSGYEMGRTITKPGEFEIQDDAATHAHLGTYIYYSKAVVQRPQHVFVAQEIYSNGYLGGSGVEAIRPEDYKAGGGEYNGQSIICMAVPYNSGIKGIFSCTGSLDLAEYNDYKTAETGQLQYVTAARYNGIYGWNEARLVDDFDKGPYDGVAEVVNNNVVSYQGHTFYWSPNDKSFRVVALGTGHWGPNGRQSNLIFRHIFELQSGAQRPTARHAEPALRDLRSRLTIAIESHNLTEPRRRHNSVVKFVNFTFTPTRQVSPS